MAKVKFPKKCKCSHCTHPNGIINEDDDYIRRSTAYFHKDCRDKMDAIQRIIDLSLEIIGQDVCVQSHLRKVINTIVYDRGNSVEYFEFALNYAKTHNQRGLKVTNPNGLYYLIQNQNVRKAWDKLQEANVNHISFDDCISEAETSFSYKPTSEREDILNKLFGGN